MAVGEDFLLPSPPHRDLQARLKRLMELEAEGMSELRQRAAPQRPTQAGGRSFIPRSREATQAAPWTAITTIQDEWRLALQDRGGVEEQRPSPLPGEV